MGAAITLRLASRRKKELSRSNIGPRRANTGIYILSSFSSALRVSAFSYVGALLNANRILARLNQTARTTTMFFATVRPFVTSAS
jgi:hypothetical protein